jgi:cysteine protease ATG4
MYLKESELDCSLGLIFYLNDLKDVIQLIYDVLESKSTSFFSFAF